MWGPEQERQAEEFAVWIETHVFPAFREAERLWKKMQDQLRKVEEFCAWVKKYVFPAFREAEQLWREMHDKPKDDVAPNTEESKSPPVTEATSSPGSVTPTPGAVAPPPSRNPRDTGAQESEASTAGAVAGAPDSNGEMNEVEHTTGNDGATSAGSISTPDASTAPRPPEGATHDQDR
jgi:hypothetical protein